MQPLVKLTSTNCNNQWNYLAANTIPWWKVPRSNCHTWWNYPLANATFGEIDLWKFQHLVTLPYVICRTMVPNFQEAGNYSWVASTIHTSRSYCYGYWLVSWFGDYLLSCYLSYFLSFIILYLWIELAAICYGAWPSCDFNLKLGLDQRYKCHWKQSTSISESYVWELQVQVNILCKDCYRHRSYPHLAKKGNYLTEQRMISGKSLNSY